MVLTYLFVSTLLVIGLIWLGRRVDGGRRSVARYHKAMDVLAEITHGEQPSQLPSQPPSHRPSHRPSRQPAQTKLPAPHRWTPTDVVEPVRPRGHEQSIPARRPAGRPDLRAIARAGRRGPPVRPGPRPTMVFVDEAAPINDRDSAMHRRRALDEPRAAVPGRRAGGGGAATWLRRRRPPVLGGAAALVSVLAVALIAASLADSGPSRRSFHHVTARQAPKVATPPPSAPPTAVTTPPEVSSSTTAAPAAPTGAGPTLSAISPNAGTPGQTVTIQGNGLMSSDGLIVVTFGAQTAPTHCPSQDGCVVTVPPPPPGEPSVPVQVRTSSGVSNALTFRYSTSPAP